MSHACGCDSHATTRRPLLSVQEAQDILADQARCLVGTETVPLAEAQGRTLAEFITAPIAIPPHDNSAMDGYGLNSQDLARGLTFPVSQRVAAGQVPERLLPGSCVRIFTGAPIPEGVDVVVPQERVTRLADGGVQVPAGLQPGGNIRLAGEDVRAGALLLQTGARLEGAEIGLLASQGIPAVPVRQRLRVQVLTTGDELVQPGQPLQPGQIYNSNQYTLMAALQRLGCDVSCRHWVADSFDNTREALAAAADQAHLVISTGGVSVGEEDHVRSAVAELGEVRFWGVAMKPGKPFTFGQVLDTPFIGLPGNPMAALVTFEVLVIDYVRRLMGRQTRPLMHFPVESGFTRERTTPRQEYLRVRLDCADFEPVAHLAGSQSSGVLSVATLADGYLVVAPNQPVVKGERYGFIPRPQLYF
ncbi:MAG: molybdopterin molybdotransferase MoeA [Marinobacter sp.]|nr:molybdopterin molybdotransferase MoeA [Marinobacter sp.]